MNGNRTLNSGRDEDNVLLTEQLAKCEEDKIRLMKEKNEVMKDFNTRMKVHVEEIRLLKEVNDKLQTDLEELRDLCCYLDDDRQKCRRLAREWQNFGHYISATLQSKLNSYQEEVNSLNSQQETIMAENLNLKRLCQDLEERLAGHDPKREYVCIQCSQRISLESKRREIGPECSMINSPTDINNPNHDTNITYKRTEKSETDEDSYTFASNRNIFTKDISEYNGKVNGRKKKVSFVEPDEVSESDDDKPKHVPLNPVSNEPKGNLYRGILRNGVKKYHSNSLGSTSSAESDSSVDNISRAMQVLDIHTKLEEQYFGKQPLTEGEVAVLKEMCNVVWRKLSSDDYTHNVAENHTLKNASADDVIYEDLL